MRGLLIGFGSIGKRHARNLRRLQPDVELSIARATGAADADTAAVGATLVTDLEKAIATRPDFAVIASPSGRHIEALMPLLQHGVPCYIEKPVVTRLKDLDRLRALLRTLPQLPVTLVGCNLRFLPSLVEMRRLIRDGRLGRVVRASLQVGQWLPDWRPAQDYRTGYGADPNQGGGVILDLIHELDAARWLFGEFDRVKAVAGRYSSLEIGTEDVACAVLARDGAGPAVTVGMDYVSRRRVRRYEAVGELGTLTWDLPSRTLALATPESVEAVSMDEQAYDVNQTYVSAMTEFLACVRDGRASSQDLIDGINSTELALRVRESAGLS